MDITNSNSSKYSFIYSPRTNYYNSRIKENKLFIELAKSFDPYTIKFLKKHFKEHLGILNKETFICIIKNHLLSWKPDIPHREKIIIKLLSRLFEEIDINSKGEIDWKDFVNYIILLSNISSSENHLYLLENYHQIKTVINHKSLNSDKNNNYKFLSEPDIISFCFYIEKYKLLGIVHDGKSNIIFYNMEKKKVEPFEIDIMETQIDINNFEINEFNMKAERIIKKEEEERNKKLGIFHSRLSAIITHQNNKENIKEKDKIQRIPTPDNVKNEIAKINKIKMFSPSNKKNKYENFYPIKICFVEEFDIIFISSSNNKISAWKFDNKKYEFKNINYIKDNINFNTDLNLNLEENNCTIPLLSCDMPQYAMCFDPGYKVLYTGEEDGKIFKWDLNSKKPIHTFEILTEEKHIYDKIGLSNSNKHKNVIELLSLSKAERALLMKKNKNENENQTIKENKNKKDKNITNFLLNQEQKKKTVSCLILINNLKILCASYYTGQIVLWDITTKKPKKFFSDQKTIINQVIYNPTTNRIYTCGFEHEIHVYDPYNGEKAMKKLLGHNASISSISFNKETNEMTSIDIQGNMKLWDTNNYYNFQSINVKEILNLENNKIQKRSKRNNLLNSSFNIEMISNTKQIILYNRHNIILFEKGKMVNPELCDDNIIIGCEYNTYNNNIMTISTKTIKFWNIFNGKVNKIYEDLVDGNEISVFELDKRKKKCYLGDNTGKIKCYNLINGILLKEFKSHNVGIVNIIHSLKYDGILFSGSTDLYIRIHSNIDEKEDIYREINILNISINLVQEKNILKMFFYNENENMLIMALSSGYIYYYDLNYNKFINDILKKSRRSSNLSCIYDISNAHFLFLAHENGEKYIFSKTNNKYYHYLAGEKLGIFSDDNNQKRNIIYSSIYDEKTERLLLGDHIGFITCYDIHILMELSNKNYNTKEETLKEFNNKLIFKKIFIIQFGHNAITHISIPINLYPEIFIAISSDSLANIYDFKKGKYIESLKQISLKYTSVPIAISYLKENPFGELNENEVEKKELENEQNINLILADDDNKNRKEKILQTIQKVNLDKKKYLNKKGNSEKSHLNNENIKQKEGLIYRSEIEPNLKCPKINYSIAKRRDIINYSSEIIIYNAKKKLLNQIKGQKVLKDKSSLWNYDIDLEYILRKEKEEQRKLYNKISIKEKDIKISEHNFQHVSLINKNYSPTFLTNLKTEDKNHINDIIKEKLRIINLSNVKKNIVQNEDKEIDNYIQKHKFPNNNKKTLSISKSEIENKENEKNKFKLKEEVNKLKENNNNKILNRKIYIKGINKTEEKLVFNTIENSSNSNNYQNKFNIKNKSLNITKSSKLMPFSKREFNDMRFLHCKNEFDEKINEMINPIKLILEKNPKIFKLPKLNTNYE